MTATRQVTHDPTIRADRARRAPEAPARASVLAPPVIGLLVSSPAIAAGLAGTASPLQTFGIVVGAVSVSWMLAAAGFRVGRPDAPTTATPPATTGGEVPDAAAPQQLGRIDPIQVPADEAIPGSVPASASTMEGQLP